MKVNRTFNITPEQKFNKINKILKENYNVSLSNTLEVKKLIRLKNKLTEQNNQLRHENKAHMKNKSFSKNMLLMDAVNAALIVARRQRAAKRVLKEGTDVDQAEVVIAANSFLDDLQDSLEKVGRLQNETLGPIADKMREYYGVDVANGFYESVNEEFDSVMDALRDAKKNIGSAITSVSKGEKPNSRPTDMDSVDDGDDDVSIDELEIDLSDDDSPRNRVAGRERKVKESRRRK